MLVTILFSKDRPMQLDATLRSFFLHCRNSQLTQVHVLYRATGERTALQYDTLKHAYAQVHFHAQHHFRSDTVAILDPFQGRSLRYRILTLIGAFGFRVGTRLDRWLRRLIDAPRLRLARRLFPSLDPQSAILFLVDDNLFVHDFSLALVLTMLKQHPSALGFSLRLGKNTTYSYSEDHHQSLPAFSPIDNNTLAFQWPDSEGDFGYPLEVSSSIYRTSTLLPFLVTLYFRNPNELEGALASRTAYFHQNHPELLCFERSVTFCDPVNVVQSFHSNRVGEHIQYGVDELLDRFERGERVDVTTYSGFVPNSCHQEVPLQFYRP